MQGQLERFTLTKAVPLAISRGTTSAVTRLRLQIEHQGTVGQGETGGFETGHRAYTLEAVEAELVAVLPALEGHASAVLWWATRRSTLSRSSGRLPDCTPSDP